MYLIYSVSQCGFFAGYNIDKKPIFLTFNRAYKFTKPFDCYIVKCKLGGKYDDDLKVLYVPSDEELNLVIELCKKSSE